jgi:deazaflavin-dependent oxidoreductase (nitroreductase family)
MKRTFFVGLNRAVNAIVRRLGLSRFRGGDLLYLTTTGRTSGKTRTVPLLYVRDGDDLVVAASNGGSDWEPGWWLNLQANPEGTVKVGDRELAVTGAEVEAPEREVLWARLSEQIDAYDGYQRKVRRRIAVVRLTPATP